MCLQQHSSDYFRLCSTAGIFLVHTSALKEVLVARASSLTRALLEIVRVDMLASHDRITLDFKSMSDEVAKVRGSTNWDCTPRNYKSKQPRQVLLSFIRVCPQVTC